MLKISDKLSVRRLESMQRNNSIGLNADTQFQYCELQIESIHVPFRGGFCICWSHEDTQVKSQKYVSFGKTIKVGESLHLAIKCPASSKKIKFKTELSLISESRNVLDCIELPIDAWSAQFVDLETEIGRGLIVARVRRRNNILETSSEEKVQNQSSPLILRKIIERSIDRNSSASLTNTHEQLYFHDELSHSRKEYEDSVYMNKKLRKDREALLNANGELEMQVSAFATKAERDFYSIEMHNDRRLSIRDRLYKHQIEELVAIVNSESQSYSQMVEVLFQQALAAENESKQLAAANQQLQQQKQSLQQLCVSLKAQAELARQNQLKITEEGTKTNAKIAELNSAIAIFQEQAESSCSNCQKLELSIQSLSLQIVELNTILQQRQIQLEELNSELEFSERNIEQIIAEKDESLIGQMQTLQRAYKVKFEELSLSRRQQSQALQQTIAQQLATNEQLRSQLQTYREQLGQLMAGNTESKEAKEGLTRQLAETKRHMEEIINNSTGHQFARTEEIQSLTSRLTILTNQNECLLRLVSQQKTDNELEQGRKINERLKEIQQLSNELTEVKSNYLLTQQQLHQALGELNSLKMAVEENQCSSELCEDAAMLALQSHTVAINIPVNIPVEVPYKDDSPNWVNEQQREISQRSNTYGTYGRQRKKISFEQSISNDSAKIMKQQLSQKVFSEASSKKGSHTAKIKQLNKRVQQLIKLEEEYKSQLAGEKERTLELQQSIAKQYQSLESLKALSNDAKRQAELESQKASRLSQSNSRLQGQIQQTRQKLQKSEKQVTAKSDEANKLKDLVMKLKQTEADAKHEKKIQQQAKRNNEERYQYKLTEQKLSRVESKMDEQQTKLKQERQKNHSLNLSNKELIAKLEQLSAESKRMKLANEELDQKIKRLSGDGVALRELNSEVQQLNKRNLDQNRKYNQLKLEKDSLQDEHRMSKKKCATHCQTIQELEAKSAMLDNFIDEAKRKEHKNIREMEDAVQDSRKNKNLLKKAEQQIASLVSQQRSSLSEKRKIMDEINQLNEQISRKDCQIGRFRKEIESQKLKAEENEELKMGKKSQLRRKIESLQAEIIRKDKRSLEEQEEVKSLKGRLEYLEKEQRRVFDEKGHSYGEKLRLYIDEINNMKRLVEDYQHANERLKEDHDELIVQSEQMRAFVVELEEKYDEKCEAEQSSVIELRRCVEENIILEANAQRYTSQLKKFQQYSNSQRLDLQKSHLVIKKDRDIADEKEREIKRITEILKQMQIKFQRAQKIAETVTQMALRCEETERQNKLAQCQNRQLKTKLERISSVHLYTAQDIEREKKSIGSQFERCKQRDIQKLQNQLKTVSNRSIERLEQEVVSLYAQNARIKQELDTVSQMHAQCNYRFMNETEIKQKYRAVEKQLELSKQKEQALEKQSQQSNKIRLNLQKTVAELRQRIGQVESSTRSENKRSQQLSEQTDRLKKQIAGLLEAQAQKTKECVELKSRMMQLNQSSKQPQTVDQNRETHQYELKIITLEFQNQQQRERQISATHQHQSKVRSLEVRLTELQAEFNEHSKQLQISYVTDIENLQRNLLRQTSEFDEVLAELQTALKQGKSLKKQNYQLRISIQSIRGQLTQQKEIYMSELESLKSQMKEQSEMHKNNIKTLEEDIKKSRQAKTNAAMPRQTTGDDKANRRLEEKLREKQRQISDLKQQIKTYDEVVEQFKRKQNEFQYFREEYLKLTHDHEQLKSTYHINIKKLEDTTHKQSSTITDLNSQIYVAKHQHNGIQLKVDGLSELKDSMAVELQTNKQLYLALQKEVQHRKEIIENSIKKEHSLLDDLQLKNKALQQLQTEANHLELELKRHDQRLKEKTAQISRLSATAEKCRDLQGQHMKLQTELDTVKKNHSELTILYENTKEEFKHTRSSQNELRNAYDSLQRQYTSLTHQNRHEIQKYENLASKIKSYECILKQYQILSQNSLRLTGRSLEQVVQCYANQTSKMQQYLEEANEELEELRFIEETQRLNLEVLKKENLSLSLRVEELELTSERVQELRFICDKLEQEKKEACFREEVMKVHLKSILNCEDHQVFRQKVAKILHSSID